MAAERISPSLTAVHRPPSALYQFPNPGLGPLPID